MTKVAELYGNSTDQSLSWGDIASGQNCPFLARKCLKNRKSEPELTIGSCTVSYGKETRNIIICPFRLLERSQIFTDCIHLLTLHEPGNELRIVPEITVPGGSIDYCLASVRSGKVIDFVGIELQTLDTTGTVWPERQRFLQRHGVAVKDTDVTSKKGFGMNWKMTAKTILMQLHHKIHTFEHLSKHLVLVTQDCLIDYMQREFSFEHIQDARLGNTMHFHSYELLSEASGYRIQLMERWSTDANGIAQCLGLQTNPRVELEAMFKQIEEKLLQSTLLFVGQPLPVSTHEDVTDDS
ncbi:NotI family restriction endonuclease [Trichormus sp. NMC-1]|uniref:NotI family restriction endonuclease n=1 Tax=Trichormus sp. NMC-1 TaxID=1853259 RepID=UPI0008DC16D6|nr:NotI family restriction endonuclease [Trichormus sp. NMC-1]